MHYYDILMCSRLMGLNLVKKTIINTITYLGACLGVMLALSGAFLSLSRAQESGPEAVPSLYGSQDLKQNQAPKIYTIYNISMDETARTSSLASQAALRKAQRLGLNKLFRKIIREEDYGKLPMKKHPGCVISPTLPCISAGKRFIISCLCWVCRLRKPCPTRRAF